MSLTGDDSRVGEWRKARRSIANGECVEVAPVPGNIAVRDSMDPNSLILQYPASSWRFFLAAAKKGEYDTSCW